MSLSDTLKAIREFDQLQLDDADAPDREILRNQFYCVNGNSGYRWMVEYMPSYDELPPIVRAQLQQSPFNICTLCLEPLYRHRGYDEAEAFLLGIKVREDQIRAGVGRRGPLKVR